MQYEWWSHEDYRANEYTMLTPDEVYKHFYDAIGSYNELEYKNPVYIEPKILCKYSDIMMDKISQTCITNIICGWNANYFTNFGFEISDEDIKCQRRTEIGLKRRSKNDPYAGCFLSQNAK